jgi:hypothetical protein
VVEVSHLSSTTLVAEATDEVADELADEPRGGG